MRPRRDVILAVVADEYRSPVAHITSPARFLVYVEARATFVHAARRLGYKLEQIAETINRERSTVQHMLRKNLDGLPRLGNVLKRIANQEAA